METIAVFGAGGVGGYFGGLLALAGHEVTFIARGDHLEAIQNQGLRVESVNGDFHIVPALATDDPQTVGPVSYLIVAVKHYHLEHVLPQLAPLVGPATTVVPLLNGVDAHEALIQALGPKPVVGGLCGIVSMIGAPGVIRQESHMRRVVVGELDHSPSDRVEHLVLAWKEKGVDAVQADDIHAALWAKFLFIASFGGVSSLTRTNAGDLRACPEAHQILEAAMKEVESLARARGVTLAPDVVSRTMAFVETLEATTTSSMQRDVLAGRPFELEAFSRTIVRMGESAGVLTPVHRMIYGLLRPTLLMSH